MKIALHSLDLVWNNPEQNLHQAAEAARAAASARVHVFPEVLATGFLTNREDLAKVSVGPDGGEQVQFLQDLSKELQAVMLCSLVVRLKDLSGSARYANRLFVVHPDGSVGCADKMHLFGLAGEDAHFEKGDRPLDFSVDGWNFRAAVCYDLRFPEAFRNAWKPTEDRPEYDVLVFVANWPDRRIAHWDALLPARAIENQSYVVGVNRVGFDGLGIAHSGHSGAWNAWGHCLERQTEGTPGTMIVDLSREDLQDARTKLPFLKDRRFF